jgi:hypothetical protein
MLGPAISSNNLSHFGVPTFIDPCMDALTIYVREHLCDHLWELSECHSQKIPSDGDQTWFAGIFPFCAMIFQYPLVI